jgi:putative restriction endonuclease
MENEIKEASPNYNFITPAEYLQMEQSAEFRSEYFQGNVQAMSGASLKHIIIDRNLIYSLTNFLKGKDCQTLPSHRAWTRLHLTVTCILMRCLFVVNRKWKMICSIH